MDFYARLSDGKSLLVSSIHLIILADLNNIVVWIIGSFTDFNLFQSPLPIH